jgi:hypothetical protein
MEKIKKMMNYKLAKKLKDAGFPQTFSYRPRMCDEVYFDGGVVKLRQEGKEYIYIPTLSELIEVCGDYISTIYHPNPAYIQWVAESWREHKGEGNTPEEAVANLWLELNKKLTADFGLLVK